MEGVFPAPQEVGSAAAHDHAVSFGRSPFDDAVHKRDHGVGIKVAEPANGQAALVAAADKNLHETVKQRIAALIQAFHGCLVHLSQPRDFSCESLVPQLPSEPFSNFFGNGRPAPNSRSTVMMRIICSGPILRYWGLPSAFCLLPSAACLLTSMRHRIHNVI